VSEAPFQRALDHVAPVARRVPHGKEDWHLPFGGSGKCLIRPGPPVHWVVSMLEQVRARRRNEAVVASHPLGERTQLGEPGWRSDAESSVWSAASSGV